MKKYISYTLALVISAISALAQNIKCGGFTPEKIHPDDTSKYTIILEGLTGNIPQSAIPMPDGLRIVGTSSSRKFSMINGKVSSQTELIYVVKAEKEGEYTVPEWAVEYDSKKLTIQATKLVVDKNAQPTTTRQTYRHPFRNPFFDDEEHQERQSQTSVINLREHVSLRLEMPKEIIYVGEAIPCKLVFSYDAILAKQGVKLAPQILPQVNKSDAFDCTLFEDKPVIKADENTGNVSISYDVLITPLKAGSYNLDFNLKGMFLQEQSSIDPFFPMPFSRTKQIPFEISTEDQKLAISSLPENGKPKNFDGAIGKFSLTNVKVSPDSMSEGEPCVVSVDVIGVGNFARVNAPELGKSSDWKTYRPKTSFTDESNGMGFVGMKHFKYTIVPTKADIAKTPNITFSYFDPEKSQYKTLSTEGASVSVAPSRKANAVNEKKAEPENKTSPTFEEIISTKKASGNDSLFANPQFWLIQALILAGLTIFIITRSRKLKLANDPTFAKKVKAKKATEKFLNDAQKSLAKGDTIQFLENARKAVQNAIAANCEDCESYAVLQNKASAVMVENGFALEDIETIARLFTAVDAINYGGFDKNSIDEQKLSADIKRICKKFSK